MSIIDELADRLANIPTIRPISITTNHRENMALPQINVRDYLDLIPPFDGEPSKLSNFINACENVLPLMAPGNEPARITFTMLHIRNKIIGKASTLISARNFNTFPELKQLLISLFGDQRNEESLLADLNTLRQRSKETPLQFADRCIDLRCLLLSKLSCENVVQEVKNVKAQLYNNSTLRAFLTGTNEQLSHLLRCKNPSTIEEAIQMVTEEENINYHRSKLLHAPQSNSFQNNRTPQLRVNQPQIRTTTNNHFQPQFNQQPRPFINRSPQYQQPNWIPRPFPSKNPNFPNQASTSQFRSQQNVFAPKHKPATHTPTPMEVDSARTRLTNQSKYSNFMPPQRPQPKWRAEELHLQNSDEIDNNYSPYEDTYYYGEQEYYEDESPEYQEYYQRSEEPENVNFPSQASETTTKPN